MKNLSAAHATALGPEEPVPSKVRIPHTCWELLTKKALIEWSGGRHATEQDAKLAMLQVMVRRSARNGHNTSPHDGMEALLRGFREDAKKSARVAAEVDVAADETKADAAGAEPANGISRLATLVGLVAIELWNQPPGVGGLHTAKPLREVMQTWPETRKCLALV